MKVLIVDDHVLFRQGIVSLLQAEPDFEVCGQAGTIRDAVVLAHALKPDLVLMDFGLQDGTGAEATRAILAEQPDCKVVFLTVYADDRELFEAIRSGAEGYLLKDVPIDELLAGLRSVRDGSPALSPNMTQRILKEFSEQDSRRQEERRQVVAALTRRERDVFQAIIRGATNKEIAGQLSLAENTVKRHVHSILQKLALPNRYAVVDFARKHDLYE